MTSQLESKKADVERRNKETIAQLEDDIDDEIAFLVHKFERELKIERDTSERLILENGILTRRLKSTCQTIDDCKERVAILLEKEKEILERARKKEAEKEKYEELKKSKLTETASKDDVVTRLHR